MNRTEAKFGVSMRPHGASAVLGAGPESPRSLSRNRESSPAGQRPGNACNTSDGRGTTLLSGLARPILRPLGVLAAIALAERGVEPVRRPLPDVSGHVVESAAIRGKRGHRRGTDEPVDGGIARLGRRPAKRSSCVLLSGSRASPLGIGLAFQDTPSVRVLLTRPRWADRRANPGAVGGRVPPGDVDNRVVATLVDRIPGPSGRFQSAPSTFRHQGAFTTPSVESSEDEPPSESLRVGDVASVLD